MNTHLTDQQLQELASGTSAVPDSAHLMHLSNCSVCSAELAAYRRLSQGTRALPKEITPEHDLWPSLRARTVPVRPQSRLPGMRRLALLAAGLLIAVASSLLTLMVSRGKAARPNSSAGALIDAEYLNTVQQLERSVAQALAGADPQAVDAVRESLQRIEAAITEVRAALERDPQSATNRAALTMIYERKLQVLQQVNRYAQRQQS